MEIEIRARPRGWVGGRWGGMVGRAVQELNPRARAAEAEEEDEACVRGAHVHHRG
jgi:hypothetical protein